MSLKLKPQIIMTLFASLSVMAITISGCENKSSLDVSVSSPNSATKEENPTPETSTIVINEIDSFTINEDRSSGAKKIVISGSKIEATCSEAITFTSSNTSLISSNSFSISGTTPDCTFVISPFANAFGSAVIVLTITLDDQTISTEFVVNVTSVNDAPRISTISDQVILEDEDSGALAFTIDDIDSTLDCKDSMSGSSSNTTLLPNANFVFSGAAPNCTLVVTPNINQFGTTTVSILVSDSENFVQTEFELIVTPLPAEAATLEVARTSEGFRLSVPTLPNNSAGILLVREDGEEFEWEPVNGTVYSSNSSPSDGVKILARNTLLVYQDSDMTNLHNYTYKVFTYNANGDYTAGNALSVQRTKNVWVLRQAASSTDLVGAHYGDPGYTSSNASPGGKGSVFSWIDDVDNIYILGGWGYGNNFHGNYRQDFWSFSSSTGNWTFKNGSMSAYVGGVHGSVGVAHADNFPGARLKGANWIDANNNLFLFGGRGYDSTSSLGDLNDLWKYDGTNWTWIKGSKTKNEVGTYGTLNTPAVGNVPGARSQAMSWLDADENLWLFGGYGLATNGTRGYLNDLWKFDGTNWTWVKGLNGLNSNGSFGSITVTDANNVPSSRQKAAIWQDSDGFIWMFGGYGRDATGTLGYLSDLWKFDGTNWTWVYGSNLANVAPLMGTMGQAAAENTPGGRAHSAFWIDSDDKLWLFGGQVYDASSVAALRNDMWQFNGSQWLWVGGAESNNNFGSATPPLLPGARREPQAHRLSNGKILLFGGVIHNRSHFDLTETYLTQQTNELWQLDGSTWTLLKGGGNATHDSKAGEAGAADISYQPSGRSWSTVAKKNRTSPAYLFGGSTFRADLGFIHTNDLWSHDGTQWKYIWGSLHSANQNSIYGIQGVADSGNKPGARSNASSWVDDDGNFWVFGGDAYNESGDVGNANDLWKFDGTNWTWMKGSKTRRVLGVYGSQGVADEANTPSSRYEATSWRDLDGNFWLYGGNGYDGSYNWYEFGDLWKFDGTNWTWISGPQNSLQTPVYGTLGQFDAANTPGSRASTCSTVDENGHLWLFGGYYYDASSGWEMIQYADLWKFNGSQWAWMGGRQDTNVSGTFGTKGTYEPSNAPPSLSQCTLFEKDEEIILFGGGFIDETSGYTQYRYEAAWSFLNNQWAWVAGSNTPYDQSSTEFYSIPIFSTIGQASENSSPAARNYHMSWQHEDRLFQFGGHVNDPSFFNAPVDIHSNDLWEFILY